MASSDPVPIVHIGYHKTGTTWFQEHFYPHLASHRFIPSSEVRRAFLFTYAFDFDPAACRQALDLEGNLPYVISEEKLCGSYENAGHFGALSKDMANRIHGAAPEADIVIFLRNQVDMLASLYAQYIKMGGTYRPHHFFSPRRYRRSVRKNPYKVPLFAFEHFAYVGLIRYYQRLFGEDRVHVFLYEDFRQEPKAFLQRFSARFGMRYRESDLELTPVNTSFRQRTMRVARLLNHFSHRGSVDKKYLVSLPPKPIQKFPKWFNKGPLAGHKVTSESLLGPELVRYIEDYYAPTNRELAKLTGLPLSDFGYVGT